MADTMASGPPIKGIPITLEASNSKLVMECASDELQDSEKAGRHISHDLSILAKDASMPIAVIGMGFRGPGDAINVERLWESLLEQREEWSPIPEKRWNNSAFYHPDHARHGTINVQGGHFLEEDITLFDAPFFNMSNDEAAAMDPQQRLLLEITYEALENAGLSLQRVSGSKTSCFVGSFSADYTDLLLRDPESVPMYQCTNAGQSRAMTANRISYFYDFKGPSVTVDTACSGSLVALHLACQSLQTGDATMAIAAGVNIILSHEFMSTMSMMRFLSPDGRCHTFDEKANGYARGEAIGCVLLKPLAHALRDENTIRAVIRGTGSNQDGRTSGITLPSEVAQEALIRDVYHRSGLCPSETDVVEAHGTGTQAGDPLETGAISRVFGPGHSSDNPVYIGSIKTNVGHLEGTSGIAGVIKAVLMLENQTILPSRNFETPNPRIPLEKWKLKVPGYPEPWNNPGPHRVSVNSFGYGGSNAHAILEDVSGYLSTRGLSNWQRYPSKASWRQNMDNKAVSNFSSTRQRIFLISGSDEYSCKTQANSLYEYLLRNQSLTDDIFLDEVAYTLNNSRSRFMWKTAVTGSSIQDIAESLSREIEPRISPKRPTLGFIFTGQGAQWAGMGRELLEAYPIFCDSICRIDKYLAGLEASFNIYDEIQKSPTESQLGHPLLSQTVCSALQISLIDLLASWNIHPDSVTGHSSGEIAAAYASGALNMEDAMKVAYYRGVCASNILKLSNVQGSMVAVGISFEEIKPYISSLVLGKAVVACINSPSSVTVSGDAAAIAELEGKMKENSIFCRRLAVDIAYHSHHMELVADEYLGSITDIAPRSQYSIAKDTGREFSISLFSSVTGELIQPEELGPQYWVSNLLGQVNFSDSLKALCFETNTQDQSTGLLSVRRAKRLGSAQKASVDCLLEVGPHSALSGPVRQILQSNIKLKTADILYLSLITRNKDSAKSALKVASTLVSMNYPLDMERINFPSGMEAHQQPRLLVDMPSYCWNHTRSYWAEPRLSKVYRNRSHPRTDLLGTPENTACPFEPRWRNFIRISEIPWIVDHKIQSDIVFPAAGYLCMAIEAATQTARSQQNIVTIVIKNVTIHSALIVAESTGNEVLTSLKRHSENLMHSSEPWYSFHIYSVSKENRWTEHCTGDIAVESQVNDEEDVTIRYLENSNGTALGTEPQGIRVIDVNRLYSRLQKVGLEYGPYFANLASAHATQTGTCFAEITIPDTAAAMPVNFEYPTLIHPCTLDSIFHTIFAALPEDMAVEKGPIIPVSLEYMRLSSQMTSSPGQRLSVCTDVRPSSGGKIVASIVVAENDTNMCSLDPKISISGLRGTRLEVTPNTVDGSKDAPIAYGIEWRPDPVFISAEDLFLLRDSQITSQGTSALQQEYDYYVELLIQNTVEAFQQDHSREPILIYDKYRSSLTEMIRMHTTDGSKLAGRTRFTGSDPSSPMGRLISMIEVYLSSLSQIEEEPFTQIHEELSYVYEEVLSMNKACKAAVEFLRLVGFKKPDMSILQLCAGTGRPSTLFLEALLTDVKDEKDPFPPFSKYSFTCRDEEDYERSKLFLEKWGRWIDLVRLNDDNKVFRISTPEIESPSYDVIIAPCGLQYLSTDLELLKMCRSILNPSGYLMIIDPLHPNESIIDSFLATALYLWPVGDFEPPQEFLENEPEVFKTIQASSFVTSRGKTGDRNRRGADMDDLIICQPNSIDNRLVNSEFLVIQNDIEDISMAECLMYHLSNISSEKSENIIASLATGNVRGKFCIVLNDIHDNLLGNPDHDTLPRLKEIFLHSSGVLWVNRCRYIDPISPESELAIGFARTARSESAVKPIITLNMDTQNPLTNERSSEIITMLIRRCSSQMTSGDMDTEYAERNGIIMIPRVVERVDLNRDLVHINQMETQVQQQFSDPENPVRVSRPDGNNIHPHLTPDFELSSSPPPGHVRIEVMAFGLAGWDTCDNTEEFKSRGTLGLECSGRVVAIGAGVQSLSVEDRVTCLGAGTARSYYQDTESAFQKIGDYMTYEVAAALPVVYTTAYFIMHHLTPTSSDKMVLIQDAASLFGQAMLEFCRVLEVGILAIVNSSVQKELLLSRFAIPPEKIFIEDADNIVRSIIEITNGKKAGVIITSATKSHCGSQDLMKCVASFGHFIRLMGQTYDHKVDECIQSTAVNISFSSLSMFDLQKERSDMTRQIWPKVIQLFNEGKLHGPSSLSVYEISRLDQALEAIPTEGHIVVTTGGIEMIQVNRPKASKNIFRADASYILVGGLGGIGRAIALWMAEKGAKNLILINRSGLAKVPAQSTVQELSEKGVQVDIHTCDISDETQVKQMFQDISWGAPAVRGIVHGAMVLKDVHIEDMTIDEYLEVLRPRYNGTWNLHRYAPTDLDFFLMLSSISGIIGNATQAAYAAGSAFMDAFASYRNTLGLPAISLDLGTVTDVGYLAGNTELASRMAKQGFQGTDTKTLLSLVQIAIEQQRRGQQHPLSAKRSQIITGLGEWKKGRSLVNFDAPFFAHFRRRFRSEGLISTEDNTSQKVRDVLRDSKTQEDAVTAVFEVLRAKIAAQLEIPVERIQPTSQLSEFGVDSHFAVELRNWIDKTMESSVSILEILATDAVLQLAGHITSRSRLIETDGDL